jgi:hypothetical protein
LSDQTLHGPVPDIENLYEVLVPHPPVLSLKSFEEAPVSFLIFHDRDDIPIDTGDFAAFVLPEGISEIKNKNDGDDRDQNLDQP